MQQKTLTGEPVRVSNKDPAMTYFPENSIIGSGELSCRVRNGNGRGLSDIIAGKTTAAL